MEWARAFIALLEELRAYVMEFHTTGLVWNPKVSNTVLIFSALQMSDIVFFMESLSINTKLHPHLEHQRQEVPLRRLRHPLLQLLLRRHLLALHQRPQAEVLRLFLLS